MQIRPDPTPRPTRLQSSKELRADITRANREGIARSLEQRSSEGDRIELSAGAAHLAEAVEASDDSAEHRAKVAELAEQYRSGRLFTPERYEQAAERLLRPQG